jgi:Ca2+-binding EF-hand superfamily protein
LLSIPQTVLLKEGEPRKWLGSSEYGHLTRISFGKPPKSKSKTAVSVARMKSVRTAFAKAAEEKGYAEEDPVCVAWYLDKGKELLDLKTLGMLMMHGEWRMQVLALQSYIKPKELIYGGYKRTGQVDPLSSKLPVSPLDGLTKSMAHYAETAYANLNDIGEMEDPVSYVPRLGSAVHTFLMQPQLQMTSKQQTNPPNNSQPNKLTAEEQDKKVRVLSIANPSSTCRRTRHIGTSSHMLFPCLLFPFQELELAQELLKNTQVHIMNMSAEFIVDEDDKLWYSRSPEVLVHVIDPGPRKEERETAEAEQAAEDALADFKSLLAAANSRGVSAAASFVHFDRGGSGVVDPAELRAGLADLGIKLNERAALLVFSRMSSDERYLSREDFMAFAGAEEEKGDPAEAYANEAKQAGGYSRQASNRSRGRSRQRSRGSKRPRSRQHSAGESEYRSPARRYEERDDGFGVRASVSASSLEGVRAAAREQLEGNYDDHSMNDGFSQGGPMGRSLPRMGDDSAMADGGMHHRGHGYEEDLGTIPGAREGTKDAYHELQMVTKRLGPERVSKMLGRMAEGRNPWEQNKPPADPDDSGGEGSDDSDKEFEVGGADGKKKRGKKRGLPKLELPPVDVERGQLRVVDLSTTIDLDSNTSAAYVVLKGDPSIVTDPTGGAYADGGARHRHDERHDESEEANGDKDLTDHNEGFPYGFQAGVKGSQAARAMAGDGSSPEDIEFMITVVPDVMQTVESLQQFFAPLLRKMPNGRILIVSLPGMPGTTAAPDAVLNNEQQANFLKNLLGRLDTSGEWVPPPAQEEAEEDELTGEWTIPTSVPHFFFGVGQGANILTQLSIDISRGEQQYIELQKQKQRQGAGSDKPFDEDEDDEEEEGPAKIKRPANPSRTFFEPDGLHRLYSSCRLMMCVNPHAHLGHGLGRIMKQIRRLHLAGAASNAEKSAHIANTMFSPSFLDEWGRKQALAEYFKTRRALQRPETVAGIGQQLRGAAKNEDLRPELLDVTLPLVVYSGAKDAFVVPQHTEPFLQAFQAFHREGAGTVNEPELVVTADASQLVAHFGWLDGGHELLIEKQQWLVERIASLLVTAVHKRRQMAELDMGEEWYAEMERIRLEQEAAERQAEMQRLAREKAKEEAEERARQKAFEDSVVWDDEKEPMRKRRGTADLLAEPAITEAMRALIMQRGLRGMPAFCVEKDIMNEEETAAAMGVGMTGGGQDGDAYPEDLVPMVEEWLVQEEERLKEEEEFRLMTLKNAEGKQDRRKGEAAARQERAEERKKKMQQVQAQQMKKKLMADAEEKKQFENEASERILMREEEQRSRLAEKDAQRLVEWEQGAVTAKDAMTELQAARDADDEEEERMHEGRLRAARQEARKKRMKERTAKYLADQLSLEGDRLGYALEDNEVKPVREAVARIRRDIFTIRNRKMDAMLKCKEVHARYQTMKTQLVHTDQGIRQLQRAIAIHNQNVEAGKVKTSKGMANRELKKLVEKMDLLALQRNELQVVVRDTKEELETNDLVAQRLSEAQEDKEKVIYLLLKKVKRMFADRTGRIVMARNDDNEKSKLGDALTNGITTALIRLKRVRKEVAKLRVYKKKWIDSDVWNEGTFQRIHAAELLEALEEEEAELVEYRKVSKERVHALRKGLVDLGLLLGELCHDANVLRDQAKAMDKLHKRAVLKPIVRELEERLAEQRERAAADEKEAHEMEIMAQLQEGGFFTNADQLRHKDHPFRTEDEKRWVGLDVLVNPLRYSHITETTAEQMKGDPLYHTPLTAGDVRRILILPPQLQLAAPFLANEAELDAHRLIQTFTFDRGPDFEKRRDVTSNDELYKQDEIDAEEKRQSKLRDEGIAALNAELKRLAAWRIRRKDALDRTEKEDEWLALDKVMHPRCFMRRITKPSGAGGQLVKAIESDPESDEDDDGTPAHKRRAPKREMTPAETREEEWEKFEEKKKREQKAKQVWLEKKEKSEAEAETAYAELSIQWQEEELDLQLRHEQQIDSEKKEAIKQAIKDEEERQRRMLEWEWDEGEELPVVCPFTKRQLQEFQVSESLRSDEEWRMRRLLDMFWSKDAEKLEQEEAQAEEAYIESLRVEQTKRMARKQVIKKLMQKKGVWGVAVELGARGLSKSGTDKELQERLMQAMKDEEELKVHELKLMAKKNADKLNGEDGALVVRDPAADEDSDEEAFKQGHEKEKAPLTTEQQAAEDAAQIFHAIDTDGSGSVDKREMMTALLENKQVQGFVNRSRPLRLLLAKATFMHTFEAMDNERGGDGDGEIDLDEFVSYLVNVVHRQQHTVIVIDALAGVPAAASQGRILVRSGETSDIMFLKDQRLDARESRTTEFYLPVSRQVLSLTISVVYKGIFGNQGYRLGRCAAALYRIRAEPREDGGEGTVITGLPELVGHATYEQCDLCSIDRLGKLVISHSPQIKPLPHNYKYQIVMGAPSAVIFSLQVSAELGREANDLLEQKIEEAQTKMKRLPFCMREINALWESMRLAERKLKLCKRVVTDAQAESVAIETDMSRLRNVLIEDDELLELEDDERDIIEQKIAMLELQFARWCRIYSMRQQEVTDVVAGSNSMRELHRTRVLEQKQLEADLVVLRKDVPAAAMSLEGTDASIQVSHLIGGEAIQIGDGDDMDALKQKLHEDLTPAEKVRRKFMRGSTALTADEQEWTEIDRILHPDQYEWLDEREAREEAEERKKNLLKQIGGSVKGGGDGEEKPKKKKKKAKKTAEEAKKLRSKSKSHKERKKPYAELFSRKELQRVLATSWHSLTRPEMQVRKVLNKYPDEARRAKAGHERDRKPGEGSIEHAQHTRAEYRAAKLKGTAALQLMPLATQRWIEVDKIRHPELHGLTEHGLGHMGLGEGAELKDEAGNADEVQIESDAEDPDWEEEMRQAAIQHKQEEERLATMEDQEGDLMSRLKGERHVKEGDLEADQDKRLAQESHMVWEEARAVFKMIDADRSGYIDRAEMIDAMQNNKDVVDFLRQSPELAKVLNTNNFEDTWNRMDDDDTGGDGKITQAEFSAFCKNTVWECPFDIDALERIYTATEAELVNEEEHELHSLVVRFEGPPSNFARKNWEQKQLIMPSHGEGIDIDVDDRCRKLLKEIDLAANNSNEFMDSEVLTGSALRYPTTVLRLELERDLDRNLLMQIFEREQNDPGDGNTDSDVVVSSDDEEGMEMQAERRAKRRVRNEAAINADPNLKYRMKGKVDSMGDATPQDIADKKAARAAEPVKWYPSYDVRQLRARQDDVSHEIQRVKSELDGKLERRDEITNTTVALSVIRGGFGRMKRGELMKELFWEYRYLGEQVSLVALDKELHAAYEANLQDQLYFTSTALHGYPQYMNTEKAIVSLERSIHTIVAHESASELINDILDWMLEGWYFGERLSERKVSGFVPSIKKDGPLTVFDLQRLQKKAHMEEEELELEDEYLKKRTQEMMGTPLEKWEPIELQAQELNKSKKAVREGSDLEHELNETECNLRFGLFCLTLMYFRAMTLLRREKDETSGRKDRQALGDLERGGNQLTEERERMAEEKKQLATRSQAMADADGRAAFGAERKAKREKAEKDKMLKKLWGMQRLLKSENAASMQMQKVRDSSFVVPCSPLFHCIYTALCLTTVLSFRYRYTGDTLGARRLRSGSCGGGRSMRSARCNLQRQ